MNQIQEYVCITGGYFRKNARDTETLLNLSTESGGRWRSAAEEARQTGQLGNALQLYEKAMPNPRDTRALRGVFTVASASQNVANAALPLVQKVASAHVHASFSRQLSVLHY